MAGRFLSCGPMESQERNCRRFGQPKNGFKMAARRRLHGDFSFTNKLYKGQHLPCPCLFLAKRTAAHSARIDNIGASTASYNGIADTSLNSVASHTRPSPNHSPSPANQLQSQILINISYLDLGFRGDRHQHQFRPLHISVIIPLGLKNELKVIKCSNKPYQRSKFPHHR